MSLISRMLSDVFRGRGPGPAREASAQALCAEGARQMEAGQLHEAKRSFEAALARDPACRPAHMGLGLMYEREGALEQSLEHLRRAMRDSVADRGICTLAAGVMQRTGRLQEAGALLLRLIAA